MADIRIKDLATTATTTASDDFMAVDGAINGTRKLSAATPAFLTSVTTPSLTSPAATNLTLAGGAGNSSVILTASGTGGVGIGTTNPAAKLEIYNTATASVSGQEALRLSSAADQNFLGSGPYIRFDTGGGAEIGRIASVGEGSGKQGLSFYTYNFGSAEKVRIDFAGNVLIGTTSSTGLTGAGGLKINSSTAGASNAGALVVTGGLSTGAASYFGGAVTAAGAVTVTNDGSAGANNTLTGYSIGSGRVPTNISVGFRHKTGAGISGLTFITQLVQDSVQANGLEIYTTGATPLILGTNSATALTIASTGAATFAGAVTVAKDVAGEFEALRLKNTNAGGDAPSQFFWVGQASGFDAVKLLPSVGGDNASSFRIQTANADKTLSTRVTFSTTSTTFAGTISPQQATTAAAPAYVKGAIYFDTTLNKLRVGGATAWETITSV